MHKVLYPRDNVDRLFSVQKKRTKITRLKGYMNKQRKTDDSYQTKHEPKYQENE